VFVPPAPGRYRIAFYDATVKLEVRFYSAKVGRSRENKSRTFEVGGSGYALEFEAPPTVRYYKLHVKADDDDDTGVYRIAIQRVGHAWPGRHL
jgi:hypothetical protein